eukprot:6206044-Amphidinium_carterae.1
MTRLAGMVDRLEASTAQDTHTHTLEQITINSKWHGINITAMPVAPEQYRTTSEGWIVMATSTLLMT